MLLTSKQTGIVFDGGSNLTTPQLPGSGSKCQENLHVLFYLGSVRKREWSQSAGCWLTAASAWWVTPPFLFQWAATSKADTMTDRRTNTVSTTLWNRKASWPIFEFCWQSNFGISIVETFFSFFFCNHCGNSILFVVISICTHYTLGSKTIVYL